MRTLRFLLKSAGPRAVLLGPLGFVGAACSAALMAAIHRALNERDIHHEVLLAFAVFGCGRIVISYLSTVMLSNYAAKSVTELRREIIRRLLQVPYAHVERVGAARVNAALTQDVAVLEGALGSVPAAVTSAAVLLGGAVYLVYLSPFLFVAMSLLVLPCLLIFRAASNYAQVSYKARRAAYDRLYGHFRALTDGTKELKLHAARRKAFLEGPVQETTETLLVQDVAMRERHASAHVMNQLLLLVVLAVVLFWVPEGSTLRTEVGSGYLLVGLYLMSPLAALTRTWPLFRAAEAAMHSLDTLGVRLRGLQEEADADPTVRPNATRIALQAASYRYEDERAFTLGPLSLELAPGEIVFVVGGNGSGKTTLGRLLTGLYAPTSGEVLWDGKPVDDTNRDLYRQLWSVVFSDLYLFDRLYGLDPHELQQRGAALLKQLGLEGVVSLDGGALSSLNVSQGQRKRLGLFVALLEDRPLYAFDEWAADQDPEWKRIFYRELLPSLRARGKGVIVITHDDRYFDAADRLLRLQDGELAG